MSSISPIETKAFAQKINALGCDYLDAPVSGGEVGAKAAQPDHHGRRPRGRVRARQAAVRADGQEHHAGRRQRRRPDHQGGQPDHRRAEHRRGRRGAGLRQQGRRRPGQGAPGADGRLRLQPHPGSARRAHDQAHLQPGLPHRAAPEGPEPGAGRRARARRRAAADGRRGAADAGLRRQRHAGPGPLGAGAGAGADGEPRGGARACAGKRLRWGSAAACRSPATADPQREFLRALYDAAVARALPAHNTARYLPAPPKGRTLVLGAGKAGGAMAAAVDALWPTDAPLSGLVVTRYHHVPPAYKARPGRIEVVEASHPVPDAAGRTRGAAHPRPDAGPDGRRPGAVPDQRRRARRCCRCPRRA